MSLARRVVHDVGHHLRMYPFLGFAGVGAAFCAIVLAATTAILWQQHDVAVSAANRNLQNLAQAMADQSERVIEYQELAQDRLLDHIASPSDSLAAAPPRITSSTQLHAVMRDITASVSGIGGLLLIDAEGKGTNFSADSPVSQRSFADRPYFRFALAHPEVKSFITDTLIGRQTGQPSFCIVRRLSGPDGAFKGVLLAAVRVDYLERLFGANRLPLGGSVALLRDDGTILVRYPAVAAMQQPQSPPAGPVPAEPKADGAERLTAVGALTRHPLKIAVSEPFGTAVAAWRIEAVWTGGIAVLGCLATVMTIILAIRCLRSQQRLDAATVALQVEAERRRAEQEMAEQHARLGLALDNMSQALAMFDRSDRLLLANAAMTRIFGLPPEATRPGTPYTALIQVMAQTGGLTAEVDTVTAFYRKLIDDGIPARFAGKTPAGSHLAGTFQPWRDGWLVTYEDVTAVRQADDRILQMALHDALTGLPNRVMLKTRIEEALAANCGGGFAVLYLDLDNFKDVNEVFGHPAGDRLLCEAARRIRSVARRTDLVARLGGDEFAVIAFAADKADITKLADRLLATNADPYDVDGHAIVLGSSIGIVVATADGGTADTLMKNADLALYRAKSDGRGRFTFFAAEMEQQLIDRRRLEIDLRNALVLGELELHYQPLVKVATRRVVGCEALMRWRHGTLGLIPPSLFIPAAEDSGLIIQMGEWAMNRACLEAARWPASIRVAVNLSPVQFRSGNLVGAVAAALDASGLAADRLELEITETTMMRDTDATLAILKEIKALGVRVAMDDFGTGYSSLAYLQRFPFDKVKIDQVFVHEIGHSANLAIIGAVTRIAGNLGIETIAEGIETEEQFAQVARQGCDQVQGYLFSSPRPANEIAAMLQAEQSASAPADPLLADLATL